MFLILSMFHKIKMSCLVKHGQIADPEINLSATLVELELLTKQ